MRKPSQPLRFTRRCPKLGNPAPFALLLQVLQAHLCPITAVVTLFCCKIKLRAIHSEGEGLEPPADPGL